MGNSAFAQVRAAAARSVELAALGPAHGPNPRVGAVLLAPGALVPIGEGWHRGAGTAHAEVAALADAAQRGHDARGTTAVVTLEPCAHTGRTRPCVTALRAAGVGRVWYAVADPNPLAGGGAAQLAAAGIDARPWPTDDPATAAARDLTRVWRRAITQGAPYVTLKLALSLDGRVAAADGTSRWITGPAARADAHTFRTRVDAIAVGTGTALRDDPALTARCPDGGLAPHQPLRVVVGHRELPASAKLFGDGGELVQLRTHDVATVLAALTKRDVRHLLVEGGPTLAAAFLAAEAVAEVHAYVAPVLLGDGPVGVGSFGVATLRAAPRWRPRAVTQLGNDVLMVAERAEL